MKLKNFSGSLINVIVAISLFAFTVSCGGGGGDDAGSVAGATGSISLTADVTSIPADGSSGATIKAYITDSAGNPVRHFTDVTFTTTLGHFRNGSYSYTVQTQPPLKDGKLDIDAAPTGLVDAALIAGIESGSAKVTVRSNNITQSIYITLTGGGAAISLVALPETIPADGASSTTITATVVNSSGTPVTPGTEVFFQTGFGTFSNGAKSYKALTPNATGIVTVSLLSGVVPGTTYIQATSDGVTQAISIVLTKTDPSYSKITVEANPARIAADGKSQSVITATITRTQNIANAGAGTSGQPIPDVPITFYKITSNAEPEPLPEANLYKGTGTSIKGPFYSYGGLIEFTMTAIPGTDSAPYFVVWLFNPLSGTRENLIDLSGDDFTCDYWSTGWYCETITKKVSKSPLPGNYQLEIQTNCRFEIKVDGDIGPAQTGKTVLAFDKTDTNGKAVYSYTADWLPGTFKIKGETGELSNSDQALSEETSLTQTEGVPALIEIKTPSIDLYADGESVITVTALVWDPAGNKVPDGTEVYFSATKGYITPDAPVTVDGIASTTLTTIASATSIVSKVTARYGTDSDSVDVTFIGVSLSGMRAEPSSIFANGVEKSTISVQLKNDFGITIEDETVSFSTTNGGLSSSTGTTNSEGLATVQLTAPIIPGTAVVSAQYGKGSPVSVAVAFVSAPVVGSIVLSANPETIPADGVSSSVITVTIRDSASAPVPKGTSVTLTTTLGSFPNSGSSYTAITPDETGVVSVPLKAGFTGGSAVVTASSHSVTQSIVVPFTTSIVASINLLASPETIPADGFSSSIITATIKDGASGPAPTGTSISFTTTLGTFPNSGSSYTVITPDASGVVSVPLKAGFIGGSAIVTASSENVSQSVVVLFTSSVVTSVNLSATPYTIKADGTSTSEIRATVRDSNGYPVSDGEQVSFVITSGLGTLGGSSTGTVGGIASVTYTAPKTTGTAIIQAMSTNGVSDTVTITLSSPTLGTIDLKAEPAEIPADGSSSSTITAEVKDSTGNPVVEGTNVTFSTNLGTFRNGAAAYTTATANDTGIVTVALKAGVTPGTAMVKAESEGVSQLVEVAFTSSIVSSIVLTSVPASIPADGATSTLITATLKDGKGDPAKAGTEVKFTTGLGTFSTGGKTYSTVTPDNAGVVSVSLIAGVVPGTTSLTAASNGVMQAMSVVLTKTEPSLSQMTLQAAPRYIAADGISTSVVTANLKNIEGVPLSGVAVTFYDVTDSIDPMPLPPNNTYTGSGKKVTDRFSSSGGATKFTMTHTGSSNFIVWLWNSDTGERVALLENVTGSVTEDETLESLSPGNYQMQVDADGNWLIKVEGDIGPGAPGKARVLSITSTNSSGNAEYIYTSTQEAGVIDIKVESGELSNSDEALSQTVKIYQTDGPPPVVSVNATPSNVYANGQNSASIEATVLDQSGNIVPDGTVVVFSATSGTISPASAATFGGIATTTLTSTASAALIISTVTATVGSDTGATTVTFTGISLFDMKADPGTIIANGADTSTISITLKDAGGVAVENETIIFSTTNGTLSSSIGLTDVSGAAAVILTAPVIPGSAIVIAQYGLLSQTVPVVFASSPVVGSITLTANPLTIPADGASSSTIIATLKDGLNAPAPKGTTVVFTTTLGSFSNGVSTYTVVTPDNSGVVGVSLKAGFSSGSALVSASSNGVSQAIYVGIGTGPINMTLVADPTSIPADGVSSSTLTATLKDSMGNPVTPGTSVLFSTDLGKFSNNQTSYSVTTLDGTGVVAVSLISASTPGTATVTASSNGVTQTATVVFSGGTPDVGSVEIFASPSSIPADGTSTSVVTATVKSTQNQVIPGIEVAFTTSRGGITSPHTTDANGQAIATLTSARFVDNNVQVTASCQGQAATTIVAFTGVTLTVTANPTSLLTGETSSITATLDDAAGNPVPNSTVTLTTDRGTITQAQTVTNGAGQVYGTLTSTDSGVATVTASGNGATGTTTVNFTRYLFTLTSEPTSIRVNEQSTITATLLDNGEPRAGETVFFSSTLGTLNPYQAVTVVTVVDGEATATATSTLTAGAQSGIAGIDGAVTIATDTPPTSLTANTQVVITGGDAAKVVFTADPDNITTNNTGEPTLTSVATLTATVYDAGDQPVFGQEVYFRINAGPGGGEYLSTSVGTTNKFGVATVELHAGSLPSAYQGVKIEANTESDFNGSYGLASLTISGPVANIGIGMDLHTLTPEGGDLTVDITAIVTDVNGNPVSDGTLVNFSVQAILFDEDRANGLIPEIDCWDSARNPLSPCPAVGTPGFGWTWFSDDVNQDGEMYGCNNVTCIKGPMCTTEDVNHNGILDPGEDKNDNGVIDPIQGCVIDGSVGTVNGLAKAKLVYPQSQANNITVHITAEARDVSNFYDPVLRCTNEMINEGNCGKEY